MAPFQFTALMGQNPDHMSDVFLYFCVSRDCVQVSAREHINPAPSLKHLELSTAAFCFLRTDFSGELNPVITCLIA